jgi:YidC/Oxa1 family membrane protein insertase
VLFIDTPMKIMNPDWEKIEEVPMNIAARSEVGRVLKLDELDRTAETAEELLASAGHYREAISESLARHVYHPGHSAEYEGKYIISAIQKKIRERKESKTT